MTKSGQVAATKPVALVRYNVLSGKMAFKIMIFKRPRLGRRLRKKFCEPRLPRQPAKRRCDGS